MNKKGEFIALSLIVVMVVLVGFVYVEDRLGKQQLEVKYIGDSFSKIAYNIHSENPECSIDAIVIHKNNIVYFQSKIEATSKDYIIDNMCN